MSEAMSDGGNHDGTNQAAAVPVFFKAGGGKKRNMRRRPTLEEAEGEESEGSAVIKKKKGGGAERAAMGALGFSTATGKAAPTAVAEKGGRNSSAGTIGGGAAGDDDVNSNKAGALRTDFAYDSSRLVQTQTDSRATATLETETEFDRDARAVREKVLKNAADALAGKGSGDDGMYRGMAAYKDHTAGFRREHTVGGEKAGGSHGPLRASAHIRWSVRFDYQADICKDYKETGYCGYGDACKFMHDRGDYKSGWQLDREWDEKEKRRKAAAAARAEEGEDEEEAAGRADGAGEESDDEEALPFACFICRQPFTDPVVTRCKHYFCEHCALRHNVKNKNCYVCNKPTSGIFNTAHEITKRQKQQQEQAVKEVPAQQVHAGDDEGD
eukprot:TRINITY_DN17135_c0_g1_i1.p2 TRINITY_DN17135_c0_g1~~TRINITY_DN17135_c0_g1_i1.p2  ORF type:complete len:384 (-),score=80.94 TRINITY_DN17135_c0_g1_i1:210-1361(-)